jgi:hypothetical protein
MAAKNLIICAPAIGGKDRRFEEMTLLRWGWENLREESAMPSDPRSNKLQLPFLWTRDFAARETLYYLERHGVDAAPMLIMAELSRAQLMQDAGGVSFEAQHRFLELAANERTTRCWDCTLH